MLQAEDQSGGGLDAGRADLAVAQVGEELLVGAYGCVLGLRVEEQIRKPALIAALAGVG